MIAFCTDHFHLPLPPGHSFPVSKYARLREEVAAAGIVPAQNLLIPPAACDEELLRVHDPGYLQEVRTGELSAAKLRALGLPWSPGLVERSLRSCGATIAAAREVTRPELKARCARGRLVVAVNLAGGTHHAFRDRCAGYCIFNDAAVAARTMQAEGRCRRVMVIDCDVHQGDGTAEIFATDPTVFTFSIHGARNYPLLKRTSDLDIPLDDGTGDGDYLRALEDGLELALSRFPAELVIYLAGADPYQGDRLGRLKLSRQGLADRDRHVLQRCRDAGIPVVVTMAGGYARDIEETVAIHLETIRIAASLSRD
jgi:acetoin utilization deacetylase AcuC-like enzyme